VLFQALYQIGTDLLQNALLDVPVVFAPDYEAGVKPVNHHLVGDLGILSQVGRNEDAALLVNLFIGGEGVKEFQGAEVIVIGDGEPIQAGGYALPFAGRVANKTLLFAPYNDHKVGEQLAEPGGQVETATVIETELEVAQKARNRLGGLASLVRSTHLLLLQGVLAATMPGEARELGLRGAAKVSWHIAYPIGTHCAPIVSSSCQNVKTYYLKIA
jgi:hypothetical protein